MSDLKETFGLACPACGQSEALSILITALAHLTASGSEPFGDHEWDDDAFCSCPHCGHQGSVSGFAAGNCTIPTTNREGTDDDNH